MNLWAALSLWVIMGKAMCERGCGVNLLIGHTGREVQKDTGKYDENVRANPEEAT